MRIIAFLIPTILLAITPVPNRFGKIGSYPVDGFVYATPVYAPAVNGRNLLLTVTMNDTAYAFDADRPGVVFWQNHFDAPRTVYPVQLPPSTYYSQPYGCLSTPATDGVMLYAACASSNGQWYLHVLDLTTGSPVATITINGSYLGRTFNPGQHSNRPALVLADGNVYIAFGSFGDQPPWQGWMFAYNVTTFAQVGVFCDSPVSDGGSIWQSGGAPAVDSSGNIYVATGNGPYDGVTQFGDSLLKLSPTLTLLDWFTPADEQMLNTDDEDLSSGRPAIIPNSHNVAIAAKDYHVYVVDTGCMGHLEGSSACGVQDVLTSPATPNGDSGSYGGLYTATAAYVPIVNGPLVHFPITVGTITPTIISTAELFNYPGAAQIALGAGYLWSVASGGDSSYTPQSGTLEAFDPITLVRSWSAPIDGTLSKFAAPTIVGDRVFMPTQSGYIAVYGQLSYSITSIDGIAGLNGQSSIQ